MTNSVDLDQTALVGRMLFASLLKLVNNDIIFAADYIRRQHIFR